MKIVPITQRAAKVFIAKYHRHHKPPTGAIFQIGCMIGNDLVGVAMCGRPTGHKIDHKEVIDVSRLCVIEGNGNACSKLYAACARIAKEMGYKKIITYTLQSETGISLKASGWINEGSAGGKKWNSSGSRIRTDEITDLFGVHKKYPNEKKFRWSKILAQ